MNFPEVGFPNDDEFNPFYKGYIEQIANKNLNNVLRTQIEDVKSVFLNLGEEKSNLAYQEGKWTAKEVLGHIIDTERIMAYRALSIARGEAAELPGFDQDRYVQVANFNAISLPNLLLDFELVRKSTLVMLANFQESDWFKTGNANQSKVSVRALAFIIAGHCAHHLAVLESRYLD